MQTEFTAWAIQFFSQEEHVEFMAVNKEKSPEFWSEYGRRWEAMWAEVKQQLHTDPQGKTGQMLLKKWMALVNEVYADHPVLRQKLWAAYQIGDVPADFPYDKEVIDYINRAGAPESRSIACYQKEKKSVFPI